MKTATGLTVIAIGAILAFAVTTSPGFLNVQVVGWILMATGALGIALMPRSQDWLRRRIIVRRTPVPPTRTRRTRRPLRAPQLAAATPAAPVAPAEPTAPVDPAEQTAPVDRIDDETIEEYVER